MKIFPDFEIVNLNQKVDREDLKSALEKAAEKVGLTARSVERTRREYELGSVRTVDKPAGTDFYLRGIIFPAMRVALSSLQDVNLIYIHVGLGNGGFASKKTIERYLQAVSEELY
jgi:hypothetical protein